MATASTQESPSPSQESSDACLAQEQAVEQQGAFTDIDGDHEIGSKDDVVNKLPGINVDMAEGGTSGENLLGSRTYSGYALLQQLGIGSNSEENSSDTGVDPHIRKIVCRYGRGCTHIYDAIHRERFWHPDKPSLSHKELENCFICNECGYSTPSIQNLALHLRQKTGYYHNLIYLFTQ